MAQQEIGLALLKSSMNRNEVLSIQHLFHTLIQQRQKSGLLGLSGLSHDTRILMRHYDTDERVRLAMEVFCYRIRKYIGAYLAALDGATAIVFGGGIGENTLFVRERVCEGLKWCGLMLDGDRNRQTIDCEGRISTDDSRIHAYVIPVEEGLMIAREAIRVRILCRIPSV